MDFMTHLPKTPRNHDAITVFIDKLSKHVHFVLQHHHRHCHRRRSPINVFRHHGMPATIISYRDSKFTSHFWQEPYRLMDVKLAMSTAYHPQTDRQTEVMNKTLGIMLRAFINEKQTNWEILLPAAEFAYNNSVHHATGHSSFFSTPVNILAFPPPSSPTPTVTSPVSTTILTNSPQHYSLPRTQCSEAKDAVQRGPGSSKGTS